MPGSLYMVVERFKHKDAAAVYRRFRDSGRMMPEGLSYVSSWIDENLERCYQLMETGDRPLLDLWMANWNDLMDFEVLLFTHPPGSSPGFSTVTDVPRRRSRVGASLIWQRLRGCDPHRSGFGHSRL